MARTTQEGRRHSRSGGRTPRRAVKDEVEPDRELEERDEEPDEQDEPEEAHDGGSSGGVFGELKNVASDAALAVLAPVAKQAITKAAEMAVKRGPELLADTVMPALEDAGGPKALLGQLAGGDGAGGLLSKLTP